MSEEQTENIPTPQHVLITAEQVAEKVDELGKQISRDYSKEAPLLVGVLKGAFVFMSDLSRSIDLPIEFDFMAVSSYGHSTTSSGVVRIVKDLDLDLAGRHVLLVEDIVDSGLTLNFLRKNLLARNPASLEICALLVREDFQFEEDTIKYAGFQVPADWLVGYGLDVAERYRNLPDIWVASSES